MKILTSVHTSLDRIWPDERPVEREGKFRCLANEVFSFQIAYRGDDFPLAYAGIPDNAADCKVTVESPLGDKILLRRVAYVPILRPVYAHSDKMHERTAPGLYPDPLMPVYEGRLRLLPDTWQSLWVTVNHGGENITAGEYPIRFTFEAKDCTETVEITLKVLNAALPKQDFLCTNWLHCDCIADRYNCEVFSERFWELLEKYVRCAAENGQNMVLTPCFTPPLDTPVGGERKTVQLVGVERENGEYRFDFSLLWRFVKMCEACGITHFEHSHLFTQWGAEHAPKIMGTENGEYKRLFGWETDADADEYQSFLKAYLHALKDFLDESGIGKRMFFHISDEPGARQIESYAKARALVSEALEGYTVFEALSNFTYYERGLIDAPVVVTSEVKDFLGKCDNLWAYYTGGQSYDGLSNRLIATSPVRNRIIGMQMYRHHVKGFLHWGFNFWYTTLSRDPYDPFLSPDASANFTGGTSYLVYPGTDAPVETTRLVTFCETMQDIRAMELAESLAGREKVDAILDAQFPGLDFHTCPERPDELLQVRDALYDLIEQAI